MHPHSSDVDRRKDNPKLIDIVAMYKRKSNHPHTQEETKPISEFYLRWAAIIKLQCKGLLTYLTGATFYFFTPRNTWVSQVRGS